MRREKAHRESAVYMPPQSCQKGTVRTASSTGVLLERRHVRPERPGGKTVGRESHRFRRLPDDPEREGEQDDGRAQPDERVRRAPADQEDEPHRERDEEAHAGHRCRAEDGERRRPATDEPTRDDGRAHDVAGRREAEGHQDAVDERQLPERRHEPGAGDRSREDQDARDRDRTRPPTLDELADERHEHAVEEEAQRHDQGVGRAVRSEVRHHGFQEGPDREAHPGREQHHDGEGDGDPPSVEHGSPRHDRGHYSRGVEPRQPARPARRGREARGCAIAGTGGAPFAGSTPRTRGGRGPEDPCAGIDMGPRPGSPRRRDRPHAR